MKGLRSLYDGLLAAYGPQGWWPGQDAFEIIAGAVLVQRTTWRNAAAALGNLSGAGLLTPEAIATEERGRIESLVRPAGFFRVKGRRLQSVASAIAAAGGIAALDRLGTPVLRAFLLDLNGVGPETADAILLYAFGRPAVVVDAYLRRLVTRFDDAAPSEEQLLDQWIRDAVNDELRTVDELNEFHALVVEHGKRVCAKDPLCRRCPFHGSCDFAGGRAS